MDSKKQSIQKALSCSEFWNLVEQRHHHIDAINEMLTLRQRAFDALGYKYDSFTDEFRLNGKLVEIPEHHEKIWREIDRLKILLSIVQ